MSGELFFSVVIPVFNKEVYVSRAIESVLKQSFSDFELIVVCDPSTDNSNTEVAKFTDPRIRVFHRGEPGPGGYAARNLGIKEAQGKWIAFLDADDEWFPEHLMKMAGLSVRFPTACFMGCGWELSSNKSDSTDVFFQTNSEKACLISLEEYLEYCLNDSRPVHTSIACVKKSSDIVEGLFPSNSRAKRGGDLHAWLKLMCHHKIMAWSNHVGARYYLDIEGQTVKTAISLPDLMSKLVFKWLSENLNYKERALLKRNFNYNLRKAWIGNIKRKNNNFFLIKYLYFKNDLCIALYLSLLSLIPGFLLRLVIKAKSALNG